jgi:DnaJ-class molecular chaperone
MKQITSTTALAVLLITVIFTATVMAAPKRLATAKAANCAACHGKESVLPDKHEKTAGMSLNSCKECHVKGDSSSLAGKLPLSHVHQLAGVTCVKCHGKTKKPQAIEPAVCESCHDPVKLSEKTAKVKPQNPHTSPHYGTALNCTYCHHQHEKAENFCNQCHKFDFKMP